MKRWLITLLTYSLLSFCLIACGSSEERYAKNLSLEDIMFLLDKESMEPNPGHVNIILKNISKIGFDPSDSILETVKKNKNLKFITVTIY